MTLVLSGALLAACSLAAPRTGPHRSDPGCRAPIDPAPNAIRWDQGRHLCYLGALAENFRRLHTAAPDDQEVIIGDVAAYLGMLGDDVGVRHAVAAIGAADETALRAPQDVEAGRFTARDAYTEILTRAASTRAVMINEAHHVSRHRALLRGLLPGLRALGYTHLAAEGLAHELSPEAASRQDPDASFGFYVRDPVFAGLVREAQALGFTIVPYETPPKTLELERVASMQVRERGQVDRLLARTIAHDPRAKLLVLAGYDHVEEEVRQRSDGKGEFHWMASEFKRRSGVDPLTVDQTTLNPESRPALEAPLYRALVAELGPAASVILFDGREPAVLGRYKGRVDLQVLHAPSPSTQGREAWRWVDRRAVWPKLPAGDPSALFMAQAFASESSLNVVPLDQVLTSSGDRSPLLAPPRTRVRVVLTQVPPDLAELIRQARRGEFNLGAPN